jgi:hypothetical protein
MGMHITNMRLSEAVFKGFGWGVDPQGQIIINMPLLSAMTVFYDKGDCEWDTTTYPNAECFRLTDKVKLKNANTTNQTGSDPEKITT